MAQGLNYAAGKYIAGCNWMSDAFMFAYWVFKSCLIDNMRLY